MRSSTKRVLSILVAGIFIIAVLLVYTSLIRPQLEEVEKLRSLVSSKEILFNGQEKAVSDVQALLQQFQGIASVEQAVSRALPVSEDVTYALHEFQALTRANNVTVQLFVVRPLAFESKEQPIVKRLGTLEVESTVLGSYEGVKNFIRGLETSARLMNIKSVSFQNASNEEVTNPDLFSASIVFQMFYQES